MTIDSARDLETYLHAHIPLSAAMQVSVVSVSAEAVTLAAPLAPNINHRSTAFGGSVSTLAILSAWSLVNLRLNAEGLRSRLVIQSNRMDYDAPIESDFTATATLADPAAWPLFTRMLQRKGRARVVAQSLVRCGDVVGGRFEGEFVAFRLDS
ncbi:MAG: thioesterase domain-containing protein [Ferrovibrio sp.]|uniref:YiiD C-terminal domain-containing protein n=1 Tax=Ferrovibrio sp. TaxID=1917215 RepID=UPI0026355F51|nr:YiiD C-terminal domain-containing protein [Ferrovibrio sp.]MCW0235716.1 thioesterase domain-containing protein [Ferrovibrio sp.]